MDPSPGRCPATPGWDQACPGRPACPADPAATLPRDGAERAVILALRFVAAFDGAEAAFGPRDGALLVARAAALVRALRRDDAAWRFLPPPCRALSTGEAHLLAALRLSIIAWVDPRDDAPLSVGVEQGCGGEPTKPCSGLSGAARAALADLAVPVRAAGLPLLPPAVLRADARATVECPSRL